MRRNNAQMIVLMGFILIVIIMVLTSMIVDLSTIGVEVPRSHSKALLPEMVNIKEKFTQSMHSVSYTHLTLPTN